jgi:xanthine dehydrogenase YagS FAD-binding subunit
MPSLLQGLAMQTFRYTSPATVEQAIERLRQDGDARALAGGTDLLTLMKADIAAPIELVNIKQLADLPRDITENDRGMTLGSLVTLAEIEEHPQLQRHYPVLSEAAAVAATPQLRNMATIGGNLLQRPRCWYFRNPQVRCWLKGGDECQAQDGENQLHALFGGGPCSAVHPSDLAAALVSLDAEVRIRGPQGERTTPLELFFALPDEQRRTETTLGDDELLLSIHLPALSDGTRSTYLKAMDRKVWAFALVGVAAVLRLEGQRITHARLVLSGVAPIPWRATMAEQKLIGAEPGDELFQHAAEVAVAEAAPLQHNGYKIPLAKALIARALASLTAVASSR